MLYLNETIERILGLNRRLFYENPLFWFEIIHVDDRKMVSALNAKMREKKVIITYIARYGKSDGGYTRLLTTVRPIFNAKGHLVRTEGAAIPLPTGLESVT